MLNAETVGETAGRKGSPHQVTYKGSLQSCTKIEFEEPAEESKNGDDGSADADMTDGDQQSSNIERIKHMLFTEPQRIVSPDAHMKTARHAHVLQKGDTAGVTNHAEKFSETRKVFEKTNFKPQSSLQSSMKDAKWTYLKSSPLEKDGEEKHFISPKAESGLQKQLGLYKESSVSSSVSSTSSDSKVRSRLNSGPISKRLSSFLLDDDEDEIEANAEETFSFSDQSNAESPSTHTTHTSSTKVYGSPDKNVSSPLFTPPLKLNPVLEDNDTQNVQSAEIQVVSTGIEDVNEFRRDILPSPCYPQKECLVSLGSSSDKTSGSLKADVTVGKADQDLSMVPQISNLREPSHQEDRKAQVKKQDLLLDQKVSSSTDDSDHDDDDEDGSSEDDSDETDSSDDKRPRGRFISVGIENAAFEDTADQDIDSKSEDEAVAENGVVSGGHHCNEIPGLSDDDDPPSEKRKVHFSTAPMKVFPMFTNKEYDRTNDDVDPIASSAEYELEKQIELMDVFPVELNKGDGGLGISIIGMGVGIDSGIEKLGIFVKSVIDGGAAHKDGRIKENDQIVEVDGTSLVGVSQHFAASVLKNTKGLVKFLIGREQEGQKNSVCSILMQTLPAEKKQQEEPLQQDHSSNDSDGGQDNEAEPCPIDEAEEILGGHHISMVTQLSELPATELLFHPPDMEAASQANALEDLQNAHSAKEREISTLMQKVKELEKEKQEWRREKTMLLGTIQDNREEAGRLQGQSRDAEELLKESRLRYDDLSSKYTHLVMLLPQELLGSLPASFKTAMDQTNKELKERQEQQMQGRVEKMAALHQAKADFMKPPEVSREAREAAPSEIGISAVKISEVSNVGQNDILPLVYEEAVISQGENKQDTVGAVSIVPVTDFDDLVPQTQRLDSSAHKSKVQLLVKAKRKQPTRMLLRGATPEEAPPERATPVRANAVHVTPESTTPLRATLEGGTPEQAAGPTEDAVLRANETFGSEARGETGGEDSDMLSAVMAIGMSGSSLAQREAPEPRGSLEPRNTSEPGLARAAAPETNPAADELAGPAVTAVPRYTPAQALSSLPVYTRVMGELSAKSATAADASLGGGKTTAAAAEAKNGDTTPQQKKKKSKDERNKDGAASEEGPLRVGSRERLSLGKGPLKFLGAPLRRSMGKGKKSERHPNRYSAASKDSHESLGAGSATLEREPPPPVTTSCMRMPWTRRGSGSSDEFTESSPATAGSPQKTTSALTSFFRRSLRRSSGSGSFSPGSGASEELPGMITEPKATGHSHTFVLAASQPGAKDEPSPSRGHHWQNREVEEWTSQQVCQWLMVLGMQQYTQQFEEKNVTGEYLLQLDINKLKALGVTDVSDRTIIKKKLKDLKMAIEKERKAQEKQAKLKEKSRKKVDGIPSGQSDA
uniref:Neurabin-1 n=1 Tax=Petromyzon marinus TaxID=7757 RepID=A0AAJ7SMX9_PETMA|nr:neurabin-1-like isoform X1 [Petromyzon marinus]